MVTETAQQTTMKIQGTPVVPGVAYGPAVLAREEVPAAAIEAFASVTFPDAAAALSAYDDAAAAVADGFAAKAMSVSGAAAEVLAASAGLARDKGMRSLVRKQLNAGEQLLPSLQIAVEHFAGMFTQMGGLMAERVTDLRDIERRITARLVGVAEPGVPVPVDPSVLLAKDLAPSDTALLDPSLVLALVTGLGGPTSHTAIIARQLGIPCVVGATGAGRIADGTWVLVDGTTGLVVTGADPEESRTLAADDAVRRDAIAGWSGPAATADGVHVKLLANVADVPTAQTAAHAPVEGVGLFRTELSFLNRADEPSVEEQAAIYADVLAAFGQGRHVVARTLDAGSDKPIGFATHKGEENPALGVRGLRLSFDNPDLLDRQLDAIASASASSGVETWVMAPMVATVAEAGEFAAKVRERGLKPGVMIEVPSAALQAARMLEVVDFLSIGTNDLTQYTMAADRMATDLAHLTDAWQPAVLQLIAMTAAAGVTARKPVGVCGEAAADPLLACVLVGLGITSLSMAPAAVRPVGAQLGRVTMADCRRAAEAALAALDPEAARIAVRDALA
ncbi:phosphoenolpyruvate--protein phosphotransferase [Nocardioides jejuensis]|nr:phosphoenolpyruvate--protein phosphotransferase [Nocardioides jejuensis]